MFTDMKVEVALTAHTDAGAVKGIASRCGLGRPDVFRCITYGFMNV